MNRPALWILTAVVVIMAVAAVTGAITPAVRFVLPSNTHHPPSLPPLPELPGPGRLLVQIFRGHTISSSQEVSITTIFRQRAFAVLADADLTGNPDEEIGSQVREIFSLREVDSLASSVVPLSGGSALFDDGGGRRIEIRIEGHPLAGRAVRVVVSELRDGAEAVATSVIAKAGKTVVLAGPATDGNAGDQEINFVCLTPVD